MNEQQLPRRDFLKMLACAFPAAALDWGAFPQGKADTHPDQYDVIVIGSGLAGLSCAAAFARQGFKALVLEQHDKPGGYATAFKRPGGFNFDVSLHSTTVGERDGRFNLIYGFPEITDVEFLMHPTLFRSIYPEHDLRVAQHTPDAYIAQLCQLFPDESENIKGLFTDMQGLADDIGRLSAKRGQVDMSTFPSDFPFLFRFYSKTWGEMADTRIRDPKLKAIVSGQWGYYGLPPAKLSCFYYALPFTGYLRSGGFYPKGRSQDISNAFVKFLSERGGKVLLNSRADKILVSNGAATGVRTQDGRTFTARAVVSNASPQETLGRLLDDPVRYAAEEAKWQKYSISLGSFQVFLGLKEDLVKKLGITDSEIFVETSYDPEAAYAGALKGDVESGGVSITLYDAITPAYSPQGKNTINLMTLQGYGPWEKYEKAYFAGDKKAYRKEKERMADILIAKAEKALLPGLAKAIQVKEIGTPLTNRRYTGHPRGAIYGWDQTVNNSGNTRVGHTTPVKNLYLAGAWSRPGHGYGAVVPGGVECFAEIVKSW
ncbi:MAG TPA: NAD(P)/FAD-dependent oxidoreductase [bacterium]|nr:NAD(P)/FAD-dependent oxidoreductase [bacterium]HPR87765.1 NAD(P)/FAD-dependent oxidoreductase [bacterium]